jgi:hypothetical protein
MDISTIYADGVSIVTSSPSYDPTQPQKRWVRAAQPGEDPTDAYEYQTAVADNSAVNYVSWHKKVMTVAQAATANLPPIDFHGAEATGAVAIPMDPAKIPAGYTLTGTLFGVSLVANQAAAPVASGDSTTEGRILAGINALLSKAGLSSV